MPNPKLSVVIPTYKRAETLKQCLEHLSKQTVAKEMEVIVVSDGHDEKTAVLLDKYRVSGIEYQVSGESEWPFQIRFFEIEKTQQGKARNEGVKIAEGDIVLFIGDDIFLAPDACERHVKAHEKSYELLAMSDEKKERLKAQSSKLKAVLGYTTWDPAVGITPVMKWLETSGWQFGYLMIEPYKNSFVPAGLQHKFTYTSNISLPLEIAKNFPFRTDVHLYGWEDIEWGLRLKDASVRLFYEPEAKALHHHRMTLEDSLKRMETLGQSVKEIEKIVPGFDRRPRGIKLFLYRIAALMPTMAGRHRKGFLKGLDSKI